MRNKRSNFAPSTSIQFSRSIYYQTDCLLKNVRGVPICSTALKILRGSTSLVSLFSSHTSDFSRVEIRRSRWPGNWTTPTNPTIRICDIKRSSVVLQTHTKPCHRRNII